MFGDLRTWGCITLILGAVQVLASCGVLVGNQAARWFAVAVVGLNAIAQMFFIPTSAPIGTVTMPRTLDDATQVLQPDRARRAGPT